MPTYAYACTACGHRFEVQQSFTDSALTECPECAGRLRKLFNTVGIVFKGSGFYRTDSRSSSSDASGAATDTGSAAEKPAASADKAPAASPAGSSSSSTSSSTSSTPSSSTSSSGSTAPAA